MSDANVNTQPETPKSYEHNNDSHIQIELINSSYQKDQVGNQKHDTPENVDD